MKAIFNYFKRKKEEKRRMIENQNRSQDLNKMIIHSMHQSLAEQLEKTHERVQEALEFFKYVEQFKTSDSTYCIKPKDSYY